MTPNDQEHTVLLTQHWESVCLPGKAFDGHQVKYSEGYGLSSEAKLALE